MHEGTILAVKIGRGFGFIGELNRPNIFFNVKDCIDLEWDEQLMGRRVEFNVVVGDKGPRAVAVRPAE